ncbi:phage tail protein [Veillonella caviae]|uniref:phage tail protein n=1 Tax=Veillonella caviae TaxID=248316 RepID=UPI000F8D6F17|nr:phage tail protein [Veillonella caviae]
MSEYGAITPTINGLTMITESVVKKKPIVFTKIAIGDGALTNQNIETLTALIRQKQEAPIHIVTDKGAGLADVSAVITNAGLSTGYYARELGVFAKVGDTGQEKLFAYTNAGANASYSPADGSLDEKLITVTFKIGTGATLKVALDSQVYLTLGNLEEHNTSRSAHADIRAKITSDINAHNSSGTSHADIRAKITSDINAHNSSGTSHADIRAKITSDINAHNSSGTSHADIRAKITSDINAHNSSNSAHADIRRMFNNYLPLTGGTVSGRTHIDSMLSVGQSSEQASNIRVDGAAGNAYIALLNYNNVGNLLIDGYFNNPETAVIDVTNRSINGTVRYRSTLMDGDGNAKFANDVYANNKLLATKEYVDGKKWSSTSITDGAITPTKLDRAYLPLTGGTITGRLHVNDLVSTGSDTMQFSNFIQTSLAGKAYLTTGKNNSDNWFNVDGYFNNPEQSNIGVLKRNANGDVIARAYLLHNDNKTYFPNEVYANNKLLATKEYVDTKGTNDLNVHNTSSSAHKPILDAIKAITGTSAFNTAPSKKLTEIITLLGQGGIVSSKLDAAAGFVKFANGFTIQWGKTPSTQTSSVIAGRNNKFTLDLPIRYATPFISIAIDFGDGAVGVSTTLTNTQVNAFANQTTLYWSYIAVGIA